MSVFTNPATRSSEQAEAYVQATLELLGSRDPLEVLRGTAGALRRTVEDLSPTQLTRSESEGTWSVLHVLRHLADSEIAWAFRLRMVLAQDRPRLAGYDQDAWAERLGYAESDPSGALEVFGVLRRANLRLIERAAQEDLERVGVHEERGEESVGHMVRLYAGHDLVHLRQIYRISGAVSASQ